MMIRLLQPACFVLVCLAIVLRVDGAIEDVGEADDSPVGINFQTQIWPILQRKCLRCHDSNITEAGLNLESKTLSEAGGHTGNTILGNDPQQSELFQRIISDDEAYRMPNEGTPLSQAEIEVFREWISQGSDWPEVLAPGESGFSATISRYFHRYFDPLRTAYERDGKYLQFLGFPLVVFLLCIVITERIKRSRVRKSPTQPDQMARPKKGPERIGYLHYFAGLMAFIAIGFGMYHFGAVQSTNSQIEQLELTIAELRGERAEGNYGPASKRPVPPRRRHPKRLGGVYYRGNDERNPKLFNGGYYRTANLDVWLSNSDGTRLKWDDPVDDDSLFITLQIKRAPIATSQLFTPRVMSGIFMSRQVPDEDPAELKDAPVGFIPVEEGERWIAHYLITDSAKSLDDELKGMVYVYQGKLVGSRVSGRIHYGIEFDIIVSDGKISRESEVWMGSIFNLGAGLLIPADNRMALGEWFDFRPIPVIEGENTTDPELLGIPEHEEAAYNK